MISNVTAWRLESDLRGKLLHKVKVYPEIQQQTENPADLSVILVCAPSFCSFQSGCSAASTAGVPNLSISVYSQVFVRLRVDYKTIQLEDNSIITADQNWTLWTVVFVRARHRHGLPADVRTLILYFLKISAPVDLASLTVATLPATNAATLSGLPQNSSCVSFPEEPTTRKLF